MFTASNARKQWQDFKKRHPNFEKLKGYKGNFGPTLDKIDSLNKQADELDRVLLAKQRELGAIVGKTQGAMTELHVVLQTANVALNAYRQVAHGASDERMARDFEATVYTLDAGFKHWEAELGLRMQKQMGH